MNRSLLGGYDSVAVPTGKLGGIGSRRRRVVREAHEKACKRPSGVLVSCYMLYLVMGGDKLYALANIHL